MKGKLIKKLKIKNLYTNEGFENTTPSF